MSSIEENGYLASEISFWVDKHRSEHGEWFTLAERVNSFAHKCMFDLDIHNKDFQELLAAAAFIRALSIFQGTVIMLERGMIYEGATLLRSLIEVMFVVCAAADDPQFAKDYILSDGAKKLTLMKKLLRSSEEIREIVSDQVSLEEVGKLRNDLKANGIVDFQVSNIAERTEYNDWYTVVYTLLSQMAAHPTSRSLDKYLCASSEGDVESFLWGPDVYGIDCLMTSAIEGMIIVLGHVSKLFGKAWSVSLDAFHETLHELHKKGSQDYHFGHNRT